MLGSLIPVPISVSIADTINSISQAALNAASSIPVGAAGNVNNSSSATIDAMKQAIVNSISASNAASAAIISGAVNGVRSQIISSSAASTLSMTSAVNSVVQQMKSQIAASDGALRTYISSDSDVLKRMINITQENIKNTSNLNHSDTQLYIDRMRKAFETSETSNLDRFKSLFEEVKKSNESLKPNLRDGISAGVDIALDGVGNSIDTLLDGLGQLIDYYLDIFNKLENGDYNHLSEFEEDLTGNLGASGIIKTIWQILTIVPLFKEIMAMTNAPLLARLNELSLRDSHPSQLSPQELIFLYRAELLEGTKLFDNLAIQGYSKDNIVNLINSSRQLLGIGEIQELFRRGKFDENTIRDYLKLSGIDNIDTLRLIELAHYQPSVNEVIRFVVRDVYNAEIAAQGNIFDGWDNPDYLEAAKKAGIRPIDAKNFWGAHWELPSPTQGYEMLFRGLIDENKLRSLLRSADYAPAWIENLIKIAYRTPTRVDTRNFFYNDVIDENQLFLLIKEYGYNDVHAQYLLEYYRKGKIKFKTGKSKVKQLSLSIITDSFNKGVLDRNQAISRLVDIGYTNADSEIILQEASIRLENDSKLDYSKEITTRLKNLAEDNYRTRSISRHDAKDILNKAGLSNVDIEALLDLVDLEYATDRKAEIISMFRKLYIDYEVTEVELTNQMLSMGFNASEIDKHITEIEPLRMFRHRDLTLADIKKAFLGNIINEEELLQQLQSLQYSDRDIEILLRLYFDGGNEEL